MGDHKGHEKNEIKINYNFGVYERARMFVFTNAKLL